MTDKTKAAIPVAIGAMAIALALGSVDSPTVVDLSKSPTPYSADHARIQGDVAEQPTTY
jgi:hypothetical protein